METILFLHEKGSFMNALTKYYQHASKLLAKAFEDEEKNLEAAAAQLAKTCINHGRIYVFGSGHSHIMAEEVYARAGGLALIKAILPTELMVIDFPTKSTGIERISGYAASLLNLYKLDEHDTIIIISNSGRNAVPVEMAEESRKKGAFVIALTSLEHSKQTVSRAPSGYKLYELADIVIDNHAPKGDASLKLDGVDLPVGPVSDFIGIFMMEAMMTQTIENIAKAGLRPPVFCSSNVDGGDQVNAELFEKYYGYWK